jgi:hypothetical protein
MHLTTFSMRAECLEDITDFFAECWRRGVTLEFGQPRTEFPFPDVETEFRASADLEGLKAILLEVEDGHVMRETLRACPLAANPLERTYS